MNRHSHCPAVEVLTFESLEKTSNEMLKQGEKKTFSSPAEPPDRKKTHSHSLLPSCCSSLLVRIDVFNLLDDIFNSSKPLSQLQNRHDPLRMSRLRFLSFKSALLVNSKTMVQCGILIMVVQRPEDVFSIASKDLRVLFNILGLGTNKVHAERRRGITVF